MKYTVTAKAPTAYQSSGLSTLMGHIGTKHPDGSLSTTEVFDTLEEAEEFLGTRLAHIYYSTDMTHEEYTEAAQDIRIHGYLEYDNRVASIEEVEE